MLIVFLPMLYMSVAGVVVLRFCGGVEVWAREQMQPAIHALRAVADSSVKHDGVADNPASLSVPWLAG